MKTQESRTEFHSKFHISYCNFLNIEQKQYRSGSGIKTTVGHRGNADPWYELVREMQQRLLYRWRNSNWRLNSRCRLKACFLDHILPASLSLSPFPFHPLSRENKSLRPSIKGKKKTGGEKGRCSTCPTPLKTFTTTMLVRPPLQPPLVPGCSRFSSSPHAHSARIIPPRGTPNLQKAKSRDIVCFINTPGVSWNCELGIWTVVTARRGKCVFSAATVKLKLIIPYFMQQRLIYCVAV